MIYFHNYSLSNRFTRQTVNQKKFRNLHKKYKFNAI